MKIVKKANYLLFSFISLLMTPLSAFATGAAAGAMPWDTTLMRAETELTGPLAQGLAVVVIAATGIGWMTGHDGSFMKKMMFTAFAIGMTFEAVVVVQYFFVGGVALG